jgi:hypothetical protein
MMQSDPLDYVETVQLRHLDIEEKQVHRLRLQIGNSLLAVLALRDDIDVFVL